MNSHSTVDTCPITVFCHVKYMSNTSLDVLMVWHAYALNPRSFLEDCIRNAKMSVWATGFPWDVINECIDNRNFDFEPGEAARVNFEEKTGLHWDNLDDPPNRLVPCPSCQMAVSVPWTTGRMSNNSSKLFEDWYGYADKNFQVNCTNCNFSINHEKLRVAKFKKDLEALMGQQRPLPGTLCNIEGIPQAPKPHHRREEGFPNRLMMGMGHELLLLTDPRLDPFTSMVTLRNYFQDKIRDTATLKRVNKYIFLQRGEKIAFRKMMSRYWDNSSPFALDLVGAVIRQGTFVQKMDNIDWLHSPALAATMNRLIEKYKVFFNIMVKYPDHMAVPTLDVDLAWHTHQLDPLRYFAFSTMTTGKTFIDHDDKVEESKLSDGFEWTNRMYKKLTNGEIYSECTCWYCEAIRAPDFSGNGLFVSSATQRARELAEDLHSRPDISSDPFKNAHISAHNAVRPLLPPGTPDRAGYKIIQLRTMYEKHRRRAEKRDRKNKEGSTGEKRAHEQRAYEEYPMVWGYPYAAGLYGPYMCDPGINAGVYPHNPSCMNLSPGTAGNCVSGTCSGAVAAGSCSGGCGGGCGGGGGCGKYTLIPILITEN